MEINLNNALGLWEERYGQATEVYDFAGRLIHKGSYGQERSQYGWNIHHVTSIGKRATNEKNNLAITHFETNQEAKNLNAFTANNRHFQVRRITGTSFNGIWDVDNDKWSFNYDEKKY